MAGGAAPRPRPGPAPRAPVALPARPAARTGTRAREAARESEPLGRARAQRPGRCLSRDFGRAASLARSPSGGESAAALPVQSLWKGQRSPGGPAGSSAAPKPLSLRFASLAWRRKLGSLRKGTRTPISAGFFFFLSDFVHYLNCPKALPLSSPTFLARGPLSS